MVLPSFTSTDGVSLTARARADFSAESFHFCRFFKGEAFLQAVRLPAWHD
jgi:hypothetical protein